MMITIVVIEAQFAETSNFCCETKLALPDITIHRRMMTKMMKVEDNFHALWPQKHARQTDRFLCASGR